MISLSWTPRSPTIATNQFNLASSSVPGYGTPDHFVRRIYSMELPLLRQLIRVAPYNTELQCGGGTRHQQRQQLPRRWEGAGQGEWELDLVHILEILGL